MRALKSLSMLLSEQNGILIRWSLSKPENAIDETERKPSKGQKKDTIRAK